MFRTAGTKPEVVVIIVRLPNLMTVHITISISLLHAGISPPERGQLQNFIQFFPVGIN